MEFDTFCETIAEKCGVKLVPLCEPRNYMSLNPLKGYEDYRKCRNSSTSGNPKYKISCEDLSSRDIISYFCYVDYPDGKNFGVITYDKIGEHVSAFYNREPGIAQEVYYDGNNLKRACNALLRHKPKFVW